MSKLVTETWAPYTAGMSENSTLNVSLTPELQRLITQRMESGRFRTASEVVQAALQRIGAEPLHSASAIELLDGLMGAVVGVDHHWRITLFNAEAEVFLNRHRSEVCGCVIWEVFPQLVGTALEGAIRKAMNERSVQELRAPSAGQPYRTVHFRAFPTDAGVGVNFRDLTEQNAAEAALKTQSERLRLALEASSLGDWSWDARSDVVTFSPRAAAIFEIPPGPHMTWTAMGQLLHPDDREKAQQAVTRSIGSNIPYQVEYRVRSSEMEWRWVAALGAASYDADGLVTGMTGVVQDITHRKQAEAERALASEQLSRAHRAARAAAWEWNLVDQEVTWNDPEQARILIDSPLPLSNPTPLSEWLRLIHPDDYARHEREAADVVQAGEGSLEFRVLTSSGHVRWFEANGQVVKRSEDGVPICMRGITLDITTRKAAEQRLRESEQQFKALANRVPNFVWFGDKAGNIEYLNERWCEYSGQTIEEALGAGWASIVHPDDTARTLELWETAVSGGEKYEAEMRYRRSDGEYRWYVARAEPLKDASGSVTGWFGTSTDIHDRRVAEQELRAETEALEILNRTGAAIAAEIDLEKVVQTVTDAGVELTGAQFGAFFYNVENDLGESYTLYTISGVPRDHFSRFPMPRNTHVFEPTFRGIGVVRSDDITQDPRYGRNDPHWGMPKGHLPVRSYLALPVMSRSGEVLGGLFFGHSDAAVFNARSERLMIGVASQAAVAIDNARLFRAAQHEIAERERKEIALRESEEFSRSVVESSGDCIKVLELDGSLQFMNENGRCLMEIDEFSTIFGRPWASMWPKESMEDIEAALRAARSGGVGRFSAFCPTAKGTPKWWDVVVTPVLGIDRRPIRLVSISRDITEQRKNEEARQLLMRELNHRVKNLFAIVSGMITMTARTAPTVEKMAHALKGRLQALAKAHELIRSAITSEKGRQENAFLRSLIEEILRPHLTHASQSELSGPDITVGVSAATSLALILHELATNAAKYGSLSDPEGKLEIDWKVANDRFELEWREHVTRGSIEAPQRNGFGSKLAHSSATGQLGGSISFNWLSSGVNIKLEAPYKHLMR